MVAGAASRPPSMPTRLPSIVLGSVLIAGCVVAARADVVFVAPTNHTMPMARFVDGRITEGILKDLGDQIARRLGHKARYLLVPSKRVSAALTAGEADGLCYVLDYWIDGDFLWTRAFIPNAAIIAARPDAPRLHSLADLAGKPVGTVLGYRYPQLDVPLGTRFLRDDATDMEHNLRKIAIGRVNYAITEDLSLSWFARTNKTISLRRDLVVANITAKCAFSPKSRHAFRDVERAIDELVADGTLAAILDRYR